MDSYSQPISVAFFGSTGGCTNACLTHTLKAGIKAVALVRNPSKLTTQLNEQGIDDGTINTYLTIIQGDATDVPAVKRTIAPEQNRGALVSTIISGIGGAMKFQASITKPIAPQNANICADAMETLIKAAREVVQHQQSLGRQLNQPLLTMISTTGISEGQEDVPSYQRAFYHHVLGSAHADKGRMEKLAKDTMNPNFATENQPYGTPNGAAIEFPGGPPPSLFKGIIAIRPALLKGDHLITSGKGWQNLRVGTEADPAVGCVVYRADIGQWIFEEVIRRSGDKWIGEAVTLTK